jgi:MFS family permease
LLVTFFLCDLPLSEKQKERKRREKTVWEQLLQADYASFVLLMPGTICLLSGLQVGAENLDFSSTKVIVLLSVGVALLVAFIVIEVLIVKHPIFPRSFMNSRSNVAVMLGQFTMGIAYNALIYFIPLHFQVVKGDNAIKAALELLSFIVAGVVGGFLSGVFTRVTGHYKYPMWISGGICVVGAFLIYSCTITTSNTLFYVYLAIFGFGCGIVMNSLVIAGQAVVSEKEYVYTM